MKRILSWLVVVLCFIAVCILSTLDYMLISWMFDVFGTLSLTAKILLLIIGGSFAAGLAIAPAGYGAFLTLTLSDKVCRSEKGIRYIVLGAVAAALYGYSMIKLFNFRDLLIAGYGVLLVVLGIARANEKK